MFKFKTRARSSNKVRHQLFLPLIFAIAAILAFASGARALQYDDTTIIIEVNATDGDAGIQIFLDGEGWAELEVIDPDGEEILESAEPSFDEQSLDELFALFPEGKYSFRGETVDGIPLRGKAMLTHAIPAGPVVVYPKDGDLVETDDLVIFWDPVVSPFPGTWLPVDIVGYQVIVAREEPTPLEFSLNLPATATQVTVPWEFLEPDTTYKLEVLAVEESGNQTISESEFETP